MSTGGKGSKPRPISVSNEEYAARWDAIFAKPVDEIAEAAAERALLQMVDLNERLEIYSDPKPQPCSWKFTDIDSHRNEHWYACETCGATDWIASYGSISQLKCRNSA